MLLRVKLLNEPPIQRHPSSKKSQPSKEPQSSTSQFDDAYYNTLNAQVHNLQSGQEQLLKNQAEIMDSLQFFTIKMDDIYNNQQELM